MCENMTIETLRKLMILNMVSIFIVAIYATTSFIFGTVYDQIFAACLTICVGITTILLSNEKTECILTKKLEKQNGNRKK